MLVSCLVKGHTCSDKLFPFRGLTSKMSIAEMLRQAGVGGKTSSPKDKFLVRQREQIRFAFPGK